MLSHSGGGDFSELNLVAWAALKNPFSIMSKVRAKFLCVGVTDQPQHECKYVQFVPVIEGSEENKSFAKYTPSGNLDLNISYDTEASNAFEENKEYYLDITPA